MILISVDQIVFFQLCDYFRVKTACSDTKKHLFSSLYCYFNKGCSSSIWHP
ncbi:Uncharacterised protein [Klebsiella variicola]|uniref:Uncharacterized protein n=1 Tax=Klebsiella variicola TaxID=244366 RepID=A0A7H4MKJ4_KLEVA|nr:Uncharacterised protein [Klebsiella variicola]